MIRRCRYSGWGGCDRLLIVPPSGKWDGLCEEHKPRPSAVKKLLRRETEKAQK